MKSSLKNMVLVLFCITLISSAGVGLVNMITADPIAKAKEAAVKAALSEVLTEADDFKKQDVYLVDGLEIEVYSALVGENTIGYAIKSATKNGFGGIIKMMVGFDKHGKILNVKVLEHNETPGLGSNMTIKGDTVKNPLLKLNGKQASKTKLTVKKDGGDVDALTAATISSRAYADAVARAYSVFKVVAGWEKEIQATTGATQTDKEE